MLIFQLQSQPNSTELCVRVLTDIVKFAKNSTELQIYVKIYTYYYVVMKTSQAVAMRIRDLLTAKNMTQYRLCKIMAIHQNTLSTIMSAKNKSVNLNTLILISRGFGITVSEFLNHPIFESDELDID